MSKLFKPTILENEQSNYALGGMATVYWDFAVQMEKNALQEFESKNNPIYSIYVFPAIIFFCSSVEALIAKPLS